MYFDVVSYSGIVTINVNMHVTVVGTAFTEWGLVHVAHVLANSPWNEGGGGGGGASLYTIVISVHYPTYASEYTFGVVYLFCRCVAYLIWHETIS